MIRSPPSEAAHKSGIRVNYAALSGSGRDADSEETSGDSPDVQHPDLPGLESRRINWNLATVSADIAAIVLPLAVLGLVGGIYSLHGGVVDEEALGKWKNIIIAVSTAQTRTSPRSSTKADHTAPTHQFASIFPIAFAAIIGRLCYQISRYKLEQGVTVGLLEQLNGSRTFGGAIFTQLTVGTLNLLGISLILLWVFSPLGTQSLLRTLETRLQEVTIPTSAVFKETALRTGLDRYITSGTSAIVHMSFFASLAAKLSVLMSMPSAAHMDTMDIWGNAKIPFVGHGYNNSKMKTPMTDWENVIWSDSGDRFSAMAGVPISIVSPGNTTMFVESAYVELGCDNITILEPGESLDDLISFGWVGLGNGGALAEEPKNANRSWQGYPRRRPSTDGTDDPNWAIAIDRFVDQLWINESFVAERYGRVVQGLSVDEDLANVMGSPRLFINETGIEAGPTRLLFNGKFGVNGVTAPPTLTAYCNVRQKYVESRVNCERQETWSRQNCTVVAQRPSRKPHPPETISHLNFPQVWDKISDKAPYATRLGYADLVLSYLADPNNMAAEAFTRVFDVDQQVDSVAFSRRLSQIINTYLLLSMREYSANVNESVAWIGINATTSSELTTLKEVYHISTLWIILALLSSVVFVAGGLASVVYTHLSNGPEILGYASTLVRDSKFLDLPPETSHMSSSDISKMIKKERVRYGYTEMTRQGRPMLGVGLEHEVVAIKGSKGR